MKKILLTIITLSVLIPSTTFGAFNVPWNATSTIQGWISPNTINSVYPTLYSLRYIASSTSLSSIFPYASTTAITAETICLTVDICRTTWPTGGGGAFPFTPSTFGATNSNSTSTLIGFTAGIYSLASSTIGDGTQTGGLTVSGGATTTGNAYFGGIIGVGTTSPKALLDLHRTTSFDPSLSVNGGFGGTDIARFYRDASSGMGVAILAPGSIPQISYRVGMSSLGAGTARNSLLVDSAGATFRISTSTTNAVNDIEPFVVKNSNSFVGIASSSPYGQFSINPLVYNSGAPSFVIGSSTATRFIVNGSGYVGIGTSTPNGPLNVSVGSSLYTSIAPLFVENSGSASASYVAQFSSGTSVGNSYPSFNLTNSGSTILNSQSPFLYYGINNAPGSGGGLSKGQLFITNGNSSTNWFNVFVDNSTNANLSSNGPIRIFKTTGGSSDVFNIASSTSGAASTTYMTVNAYGSVGIGTSTMFSRNKLTISNPDSTTELSLTNGSLTSPQWAFNVLQNGDLAIATSSPSTGATSTLTSLLLSATGNAGLAIGTSTLVAVINGYAVTASSTNLLLDAVSKGGCFIMKDVNGTGYSQFTAQGGVLTGKVATSLNQCN